MSKRGRMNGRKQQPRVKDTRGRIISRFHKSTRELPQVASHVREIAEAFNVTESWVRSTAMANYFGIAGQPDYMELKRVVSILKRRQS